MKLYLGIFVFFLLSSCTDTTSVELGNKDLVKDSTDNKKHSIIQAAKDSSSEFEIDYYKQAKEYVDSLFLANQHMKKFEEQSFLPSQTVLLIGNLFSPKYKHAIIGYQMNDSIYHYKVLRFELNKWNKDFETYVLSASGIPHRSITLVETTDLNGDKIPDLKIIKSYWDMHIGENSDAWVFKNNTFTKVEGFDKIISAEYDPKTNLIYSYQSNGCADMAMFFGVYKIENFKVKEIKEMICDCCGDSSCVIDIEGQKPYSVPIGLAYKHVPIYWSEPVKEKCKMVSKK